MTDVVMWSPTNSSLFTFFGGNHVAAGSVRNICVVGRNSRFGQSVEESHLSLGTCASDSGAVQVFASGDCLGTRLVGAGPHWEWQDPCLLFTFASKNLESDFECKWREGSHSGSNARAVHAGALNTRRIDLLLRRGCFSGNLDGRKSQKRKGSTGDCKTRGDASRQTRCRCCHPRRTVDAYSKQRPPSEGVCGNTGCG